MFSTVLPGSETALFPKSTSFPPEAESASFEGIALLDILQGLDGGQFADTDRQHPLAEH